MALPAIAAAVKTASALFFHMVFSFRAGMVPWRHPNSSALNLSRAG